MDPLTPQEFKKVIEWLDEYKQLIKSSADEEDMKLVGEMEEIINKLAPQIIKNHEKV